MTTRQIAAAIKTAHELNDAGLQYRKSRGCKVYTVSWDTCWRKACEQHQLPLSMAGLLELANHWEKDLAEWADMVDDNA